MPKADKQVVLTDEGKKKLEDELDILKSVTRNEVSEKIKIARSFGDLSENSEYDEAKNEQARVEARIAELEQILKNAVVLDESAINNEHVNLGIKVKVKNNKLKKEFTYTIVGSAEADPLNGKLSDESPVGAALMGHTVGETVVAETPAGEVSYKILEISR